MMYSKYVIIEITSLLLLILSAVKLIIVEFQSLISLLRTVKKQ